MLHRSVKTSPYHLMAICFKFFFLNFSQLDNSYLGKLLTGIYILIYLFD